jgi:hypothetical protein
VSCATSAPGEAARLARIFEPGRAFSHAEIKGEPRGGLSAQRNDWNSAMKRRLAPLIGVTAALLLSAGCADGGFHHGGMAMGYDGYYDSSYGPIYDGYWGADNFFYYTDAAGHPFQRDEAHHFRHDAAQGYHAVHGNHRGPIPDHHA